MSNEFRAYAELQRDVMASLRAAHPNWTEDIFESYEARFGELLRAWTARGKPRPVKSTVQMT